MLVLRKPAASRSAWEIFALRVRSCATSCCSSARVVRAPARARMSDLVCPPCRSAVAGRIDALTCCSCASPLCASRTADSSFDSEFNENVGRASATIICSIAVLSGVPGRNAFPICGQLCIALAAGELIGLRRAMCKRCRVRATLRAHCRQRGALHRLFVHGAVHDVYRILLHVARTYTYMY